MYKNVGLISVIVAYEYKQTKLLLVTATIYFPLECTAHLAITMS